MCDTLLTDSGGQDTVASISHFMVLRTCGKNSRTHPKPFPTGQHLVTGGLGCGWRQVKSQCCINTMSVSAANTTSPAWQHNTRYIYWQYSLDRYIYWQHSLDISSNNTALNILTTSDMFWPHVVLCELLTQHPTPHQTWVTEQINLQCLVKVPNPNSPQR